MTLWQPWKERRGKVNLQQKAFVRSYSRVLGGGRPAGTHYAPLASAKAVTLTNSQRHNTTVVQFVFSLNPLYAADTKAAGPNLSNAPQRPSCTKLHFYSFLGKKQSLILLLHFLIPHLITQTLSGCFGRRVWQVSIWWKLWISLRKGQ